MVDDYDPDFIYTDGNEPFTGRGTAMGVISDAAVKVVAHYYNKRYAKSGVIDCMAIIKGGPRVPGVARRAARVRRGYVAADGCSPDEPAQARGCGGPRPGDSALSVRPLPDDLFLAAGQPAGKPAGQVEQFQQSAVALRLPHRHQRADELLAGGSGKPVGVLPALCPVGAVDSRRADRGHAEGVRQARLADPRGKRPVRRLDLGLGPRGQRLDPPEQHGEKKAVMAEPCN